MIALLCGRASAVSLVVTKQSSDDAVAVTDVTVVAALFSIHLLLPTLQITLPKEVDNILYTLKSSVTQTVAAKLGKRMRAAAHFRG